MEEGTGTFSLESLWDKAMLRYAENLESGAASIEENVEAVISEASEEVSFVKWNGRSNMPTPTDDD